MTAIICQGNSGQESFSISPINRARLQLLDRDLLVSSAGKKGDVLSEQHASRQAPEAVEVTQYFWCG